MTDLASGHEVYMAYIESVKAFFTKEYMSANNAIDLKARVEKLDREVTMRLVEEGNAR